MEMLSKGSAQSYKSFEWQEAELVRQMCQINVQGKVVARGDC